MAFIKQIKRKWQGQEKWSVTTVTQGSPVSTKELCEYIADSTTASASDVMAVLMSLPKVMELYLKNGRAVKLEGIGTYRYKVSAGMVSNKADAAESLIRDIRVQFTPERTVTAVGKQRIVRRALIPDNLTWEIYDKPSKPRPTSTGSGSGGTTPTPDSGTGGGGETPDPGTGGGTGTMAITQVNGVNKAIGGTTAIAVGQSLTITGTDMTGTWKLDGNVDPSSATASEVVFASSNFAEEANHTISFNGTNVFTVSVVEDQ